MMTSSNGNIFRVTGHLCGEFTGPGEFPVQSPVMRSFDIFFDLSLNKRLSKQSRGWWFEMQSVHHDVIVMKCHNILHVAHVDNTRIYVAWPMGLKVSAKRSILILYPLALLALHNEAIAIDVIELSPGKGRQTKYLVEMVCTYMAHYQHY